MDPHQFKGTDAIKIIDFLESFRRACDDMGVHEDAAVFLFGHFMVNNPKQDLLSRIESGNSTYRRTERREHILTSYCKVVNYLLATYADNQTISRTNNEIIRLSQKENQSPVKFKDFLWTKTSRCGCVYGQKKMIHFFIEGCNKNIRNLVRQKFCDIPGITLTKLAEYARDIDARPNGTRWSNEVEETDDSRRRKKRDRNTTREDQANTTPLFSTDAESSTPTQLQPADVSTYTNQSYRANRLQHPEHLSHNNNNSGTSSRTNSGPHVEMFPHNRRNDPRQVNFQNTPPTSSPGSADQLQSAIRSMDSGLYCRVCFAPTTNHVTSACPHTAHNRQSFIEQRDANY